MKNVTGKRIVTYLVLILWLIAGQWNDFVVLIANDFSMPQSNAWNQVVNLNVWLYGLLLFGSFSVITLVIALNRDDLQQLNIDRLFMLLFLISGAIGLYSLHYNCFSWMALVYIVYALLTKKMNIGAADQRRLQLVGWWAIPVSVTVLLIVASILDWSLVQQRMSHFLLESAPGAVFEEAVYRGMLFMLLRDCSVSESKIIYVQALLFWIAHLSYLPDSPFFFWIVLPILGFVLGYVAVRFKSIGLSAILHIGFNFASLFTSLTSQT